MGYSKSELYGNAKLRPEDVRAVRRRAASWSNPRGESARALAREFNCAPETIRKLLRGETYTMVSDEGPATAAPSEVMFSEEEIEASKQRLLVKLGLAGPTPDGQASDQSERTLTDNALGSGETRSSVPASLEEALKAQALRDAAEQGTGLERLQKEAGRPAELLAELERGKTDGGGK